MLKVLSKEEYLETIKLFKVEDYHLSQSSNWDNIQAVNFPDQVRILYTNTEGKPLIIGRVTSSRILKKFSVLQLNYGPIINLKEITQVDIDNFLKEIKEHFQDEKIFGLSKNIFLQLSPLSLNKVKNEQISNLLSNSSLLKVTSSPLRKLNSTITVDLNISIDELLLSFRKDVRYNLKKLQSEANVEVLVSSKDNKEEENKYYEEFWSFFTKSIESKHFEDPGKKMYDKILSENQGRIMLLKLNGEILSGAFLYEFKEQDSLIILSSYNTDKGLEYKSPTYIRFEIIKWAKENGYKTVDFFDGGSTKGIREFKLGFSNNLIEYPECYDLVINKSLYKLALSKVFKY